MNELVSGTCSQKIDPQVNVTTQNIKYPDKIVMVISVPSGSNKFYMANGKDIWVKVGADKRRAKRAEIQRILQSSGHLYADEMPVENTNLDDINIDLLKSFYERRTCENAGITVDFIEEKDNGQFKVIFYRN